MNDTVSGNLPKRETVESLDRYTVMKTMIGLRTTDSTGFNAQMRWFQDQSGLRVNQVAAKIPHVHRSQVHALLREGRVGLPTKVEQVGAILQACNVSAAEITLMLDAWKRLNTGVVSGTGAAGEVTTGRRPWTPETVQSVTKEADEKLHALLLAAAHNKKTVPILLAAMTVGVATGVGIRAGGRKVDVASIAVGGGNRSWRPGPAG